MAFVTTLRVCDELLECTNYNELKYSNKNILRANRICLSVRFREGRR